MTGRANPISVPLFIPNLNQQDKDAVLEVLNSGWITMGPKVAMFEENFAAYIGSKHAIAVNSCTAALHLANILANIGPGDEVIVPSMTFAATANSVSMTGATPVFADIKGPSDWTLDPDDVLARITPNTKAVIAMHFGGYPCDMDRLLDICESKGLTLIEDSAHALTGTLHGRHLGTFGQVGCFSFFSNKVMTTAEGGMLVTNDDAFAERARRLRSHGQSKTAIDRMRGALGYEIDEAGYNYRLDDIRAALGVSQLARVDEDLHCRARLYARYKSQLASMDGVSLPDYGGRGTSAHHILTILLDTADRDAVRAHMAEQGIQTSHHYPPVHKFQNYLRPGEVLKWTEYVSDREITLPLYPIMSLEQVDRVVEVLRDALAHVG